MADPVKFDFSSYPVAIPAIPAIREQELQPESQESRESHRLNGENAGSLLDEGPPLNRRIARIAEGSSNFQDDRHHCRECRHLSSSGYCIQQRFRPVDDIPRRCDDFTGYPPATDGDRTSESVHNAAGRYFKFLATWPDGRQCDLCQMPRQTVDEMRAQFPDAVKIEPVTGEHYDD